MNNKRRKIIKTLIAAGASGSLFKFSNKLKANDFKIKDENYNSQDDIFYNHVNFINVTKPIIPKGLSPGSKMAVIAPASHASIWELRHLINTMKQLEIEVEVSDTIKNYKIDYRYFSAPDEVRLEEFMSYIQREDIDAIMSCRGGYGVMRILDMIDFEVICKKPKIIIGFSDITALLNAIYNKCNLVTYHGPVGVSTFNNFSLSSFKKILFKTDNFKPIEYSDSRIRKLTGGKAKGRLVGGNLTMVVSTLGSSHEIQTEDNILFLEEVSEDPYKIDRMLTQLYISNKLQKCAGIMFGYYPALDKKYYFYPNLSYTAREVIESRLKQLNIPAVLGVPIGHIEDKWTLPIGIMAELDADKEQITILEPTNS
jgi:muramoyltetrapeptide carboxypeptidase